MRIPRAAAPAVLGLLLAVSLAACSGKSSAPGAGGSASPTLSEPTAGAGATSTTTTTTGTTTGTGNATTTGGTTTGGTTTGVPPGAQPFVARPAGTYYYATNGTTKIGNNQDPMPARTSLAVDQASGNSQRSVRDLRDAEGRGRVTETRVRSEADGIHLTYLKTTTRLGGITDERTFEPNPPPLILRTGAPDGDHLEFTIQSSGEGSRVRVDTVVDVLRRETITIGGTALQAIVIRIRTTFSGDVEGSGEATNWIRPTDGLLLRETDRSSVRSGFVRVESNYTATLEKLTPS